MAFALSGSLITQTGTDTDLSGLSAIAGVTVKVLAGGYKIYETGTLRLSINGNLTIGGTLSPLEQLVFGTDVAVTSPLISVNNGGVLNIGRLQSANTQSIYETSRVLLYQVGQNKGYQESAATSTSTTTINILSGGTLNWYSGTIDMWGAIRFSSGSFPTIGTPANTLTKPVLDYNRVYRTAFPAQMVYSYTDKLKLYGLVFLGGAIDGSTTKRGAAFVLIVPPEVFEGYEPYFVGTAFFGSTLTGDTIFNYYNLLSAGSAFDLTDGRNVSTRGLIHNYINFELGSGIKTRVATGSRSFIVVVKKQFTVNILNLAKENINGGVLYFKGREGTQLTADILNGNVGLQEFTLNQRIYDLVPAGNPPTSDEYFSKNSNSTDLIDTYVWHYGYTVSVDTGISLKGRYVLPLKYTLFVDNNTTLSENDAVAKLASSFSVNSGTNTITVTANSTLDDLYDVMKAWKTRNVQAQLEYPTISTQPVVASGENLVTAMNIVGIEFLTTGTKFKTLQANATANGIISDLSIVGNVNQATPTNLSNVQISGTLTYNTNVDTTITIINTTIGTVVNNGTGIITINKVNSTIENYTDAEINFIDSTISVIGADTVTFHPTANDRDLNTNASGSFSGSSAFKFGSTINGSLMSGTLYLRCVAGGIPFNINKVIVLGDNLVDLGQTAQLASISAKIDLTAKQESLVKMNGGLKKIAQFKPYKTDL